MPTIHALARAMEEIAPLRYAESWDRVGLLVGDPAAALHGPVVLTIDLTERVLEEAIALRAGAVVAYHPLIWEPLKRLSMETAQQRVVLRAAREGMAVYCPHTALDAVPGGITDWLCEGLSGGTEGRVAGDCRALVPHAALAPTQQVKIITFVPRDKAEGLRDALSSAGAGLIGNYGLCAFLTDGTGTFLPGAGAKPTVGRQGTVEKSLETRLEMVCSNAALPIAIETLRRFHPYEEPAIDVVTLSAIPDRHAGAGRRLQLDTPVTLRELAVRLKGFLACSAVHVAAAGSMDDMVARIGVCPGSGSSLAGAAKFERLDVYVSGEMTHHDVMAATASGLSVILAGHTNTERGYLPRLAGRLRSTLPGAQVRVSERDVDPMVVV